jgi:integrase
MIENIKIALHNYDLDAEMKKVQFWNIPASEKKKVVQFIKEFIAGRVSHRKPNPATARNLLVLLKTSLEVLHKESSKLTRKDIIIYSDDLAGDKIKKNIQGKHEKSDKPYKEPVKLRIKYSLAIYLKWLLKEKATPFVEVLKIKPTIKRKSVDFLTEEEITKLLNSCKSDEERFLIGILFDSGLRAEELYNIRKEDIELPKDAKYYRIHIKTEYSKTEGRTISLAWHKSYEIMKAYLEKKASEGIRAGEPVFSMKYRTAREFLYRLGQRVLGRKLYFHLFRHSSATFYANKINRQQLCIRYGWKFSSDMPDTYISRSGVDMKDIEEKADNIERIQIKEENNKLKTEMALIKETSEKGRDEIENLRKAQEILRAELEQRRQFDPLLNQLAKQLPHLRQLEKNLENNQKNPEVLGK